MLKEKLLGAWQLISFQNRWADGRVSYMLGEDALGLLVYDASGFFSAQLMKQNRPNFASNDMMRGNPEEIRMALNGYLAYWGRFVVNEAESSVNHFPIGSLFPNWIGGVQPRKIMFEGERLTLSSQPVVINGMEGVSYISWERAK